MTLPTIAFCTTCKGRLQHLERTLPVNLADNAGYPGAKFVVLDYGSQDGLEDHIIKFYGPEISAGRLVYYRFPTTGKFKMAHSKNMAHRLGILEGADILVNLDADNYAGKGFAGYVTEQLADNPDRFLRAIKGPENPRGVNGRIVVTAKQFRNVGGYDEKFSTWSPDDEDFSMRLTRLGYFYREIESQYLDAIKHGDRMRFREYKHAQAAAPAEDDLSEVRRSNATIANYGRYGMGTVYRNFSKHPTYLGPVPTRIFGVGMHKTATTSLHHALELLGLDSAHWIHPDWAKAVWQQMNNEGRSLTLERFYAACDLPVTLLYEQLDIAYPGSKFILTVRNERKWIRSVQAHWSYEHNPYRHYWDESPFTHRMHRRLYGQEQFNAEIFLARYRRHNAEVIRYFKDRPGDLLVMDMDKTAGWPDLCEFLKQPVPSMPYPTAFKTNHGNKSGTDRVPESIPLAA